MKKPKNLSLPFDLTTKESTIYRYFERQIKKGIYFLGDEIYLNSQKINDYYSQQQRLSGFTHLVGLKNTQKYKPKICISTSEYPNCNEKTRCGTIQNRIFCLFRARRIKWFFEILDLINNGNFKYIKAFKKFNNRKKNYLTYIRYRENFKVDYLIILSENTNTTRFKYTLVSAHQIVEPHLDQFLKNEYCNFQNQVII